MEKLVETDEQNIPWPENNKVFHTLKAVLCGSVVNVVV